MTHQNVDRPRARELGWIPDARLPTGRWNALTDVPGVRVGHATIIRGSPGPLEPGVGPVRTGVTAILPGSENLYASPVRAAVHVLNGYGKTLGLEQIRETGRLESPVLLTNTLNVWRAADALVDWILLKNPQIGRLAPGTFNPVVGECNDSYLNDIQGRHVTKQHVWDALAAARSGPVAEGNVGGGTGTIAFGYKAGIGTASRVVSASGGDLILGALVQANFGSRAQLRIRGLPMAGSQPKKAHPNQELPGTDREYGSCMMIIATNAPLSARQLSRIARRGPLGLARLGSVGAHGSGDYAIAFTADRADQPGPPNLEDGGRPFSRLLQAAVECTEEAVLNSLAAAETMLGRDGHIASSLQEVEIDQAAPD